jgi:hypothetical protein
VTPSEQNHLIDEIQLQIVDVVKTLKHIHGEMARPMIAANAYQKPLEDAAKSLRRPMERLNSLRVAEPALDPLTEVAVVSEHHDDLAPAKSAPSA